MAGVALRAKTKGTYAPQPKAPSAPEKKAAPLPPAPPLSSIKLRDREGEELNAGLAQYGLRVPALGEFGEGGFRVDEGVIPRRWARESATVMALARRVAAKKEQYERSTISRDEAREKNKEERTERKASLYRGMTHLKVLLAELGPSAPSEGRARKAIERAHMIHRKFHFGPKDVEQARKVLREVPAVAQRTGASGVAARSPSSAPAPDGFVVLHVTSNPHKEGTEQHRRMAKLMVFAGQPAREFLAAGGCRLKLKHAVAQGWVTLGESQERPAAEPATAPKKTSNKTTKEPAKASSLGASPAKAKAEAKARVRAKK